MEHTIFVSIACTYSSSAEAGFMMVVQNELNIGQLLVNETGPGGDSRYNYCSGARDRNYHVLKDVVSGVARSLQHTL